MTTQTPTESGVLSYLPARSPRRLLLMLHGCTQNAADFALGTRLGELGPDREWAVVFPEQPESRHPRRCWNWYRDSGQRLEKGELKELLEILEHWQAKLKLPAERTFVAGLSAGGAMTANLIRLAPDRFRAFAVHSGLPPLAATTTLGALAAMKGLSLKRGRQSPLPVPGLLLHGSEDRVVHPSNSERFFEMLGGGKAERRQGDRDVWAEAPNGSRLHLYRDVGHAWSGGHPGGSHTDPNGPDSSAAVLDFFEALS